MRARYHHENGRVRRIELLLDDGEEVPALPPAPVSSMPLDLPPGTEGAGGGGGAPADSGQEGGYSGQEGVQAGEEQSRAWRGSYGLTERVGMGTIRSGWMEFFGLGGAGITFLADNLATLPVQQPWLTVIGFTGGCVAYGMKRGIIPDSKL